MTDVARNSGVTLWRQIAETLSDDLSVGALKPGDRLPTELDLAARFAVNRHTVRRAVAALADRGFVRVEQGRGTFVAEHMIDYALGRRTRFSENVAAQGREPGGRMLGHRVTAASASVAADLDIAPGSAVLCLETLRAADGVPLSLATHFFPEARFHGLADIYAAAGSITAALGQFGIADYVRRVTRLSARLPTDEEARHLAQPATRPILQSEAIDADLDGRPIQSTLTRFAGDRVQVTVETA
jgi:GntR family transcriptional regulator, phosphonate transport system regulatory protein